MNAITLAIFLAALAVLEALIIFCLVRRLRAVDRIAMVLRADEPSFWQDDVRLLLARVRANTRRL